MRRFLFGVVIASVTTAMPAWAQGGDREIAQALMAKLQQQKAAGLLRGFEIDLKVDNGTVYLDGHVTTKAQYELVTAAAEEVAGKGKLVNSLDIKNASKNDASSVVPAAGTEPVRHPDYSAPAAAEPAAPRLPAAAPQPEPARSVVPAAATTEVAQDGQITDAVIAKLQEMQSAGLLRGFRLDVTCNQGDLILSGHVSTEHQKSMVLDVARRTRGVKRVVDGIRVAGAAVRPVAMQQPAPIPDEAPAGPMPGQQPQPVPMAAQPVPMHSVVGHTAAAPRYDQPNLPSYAWPTYAPHPNYAAVTYPKQYSPSAWPYIGPFYPYPQVPLGWRRVSLEWDDGLWYLDFTSK